MADQERLQKFLARAGVASRRACELLIEAGRVRVNGVVVTELGSKVDPVTDAVELDGQRLGVDVRLVYLLVYKPVSMISAVSDPEGRPVVTSLVPSDFGRVYPVGRLDWDSEGALLLTNDGELHNLLTHPKHEVVKTYMVKVRGRVGDDDRRIERVRDGGIILDGKPALPAEVMRDSDTGLHTWFVVGLREGRNRQIRRVFEAVGLDVLRLRRIAYGPVYLADLEPGDFRRLSEEEIEELYEAAGAKRPTMSASRGRLHVGKRAGAERAARSAAGPPPERDPRAGTRTGLGRPGGGAGGRSGGDPRRAEGPPREARPPERRDGPHPSRNNDRRDAGPPRSNDRRDGAPPRGDERRDGPRPAWSNDRRDAGPPRSNDRRDGAPSRGDERRDGPRPPRGDDRRDGPRPPRSSDRRDAGPPPRGTDRRDGAPPRGDDRRDGASAGRGPAGPAGGPRKSGGMSGGSAGPRSRDGGGPVGPGSGPGSGPRSGGGRSGGSGGPRSRDGGGPVGPGSAPSHGNKSPRPKHRGPKGRSR